MTPHPPRKLLRCAFYRRKSTEHNLDLEFNSLLPVTIREWRRSEPDGADGVYVSSASQVPPTSFPQWFALKPRRCWGFFYVPLLRAPIRRFQIGFGNIGLDEGASQPACFRRSLTSARTEGAGHGADGHRQGP
jgi:hypothetical protein